MDISNLTTTKKPKIEKRCWKWNLKIEYIANIELYREGYSESNIESMNVRFEVGMLVLKRIDMNFTTIAS